MPSIKVKRPLLSSVDFDTLKMHANEKSALGSIPTSITMNFDSTIKTDFLEIPNECKVIFFEYQSDFFSSQRKILPKGFLYMFVSSLEELNIQLKEDSFQIVVFNYDQYTKAINQMCAEIKKSLPKTKVLIVSQAIEPDKAQIHANSPSGADGYFQLPLEARRLDLEFYKIHSEYREKEMRA
jgi:DNA-binding NtrC family response regulator